MTVFGALFILVSIGIFFYHWNNDSSSAPPPPSNRWEPNASGGYDPPAGFVSSHHDLRDSTGRLIGYLQVNPTRTSAYTNTGSYKGYYCHASNQTFDNAGNLVGYGNHLYTLL